MSRSESIHPVSMAWVFQANTLTNTNATRFLAMGYLLGTNPAATEIDFTVRHAFAVYAIDLRARVAGTAGQTMTAGLRKNGVVTNLLTSASNALSGAAVFAPVAFLPGDLFGFQVTKSGAFTSPVDVAWTLTIINS